MKIIFDPRRLSGRLFYCLISVLLAMGLTHAQTPPATTQIVDIVYRSDGTAAQGTILISWPSFTTADQKAVAAGAMSVPIGAGGAVALALAPNAGAEPAGTYYKVVYQLSGGENSEEYWSVPAAGPTTIGAIRSRIVPAGVALQVASRQYVDTALAAKANDADVVHKSGSETIAGTKTFSAAPLVPAPAAAQEAANKAYVDANSGAGGNAVVRTPTASQDVVQPPGTQFSISGGDGLNVEKLNQVRFADKFAGADAGAKIAAAIADLPASGGMVMAHFASPQTINTTLTINKPVHLRLSGSFTCAMTEGNGGSGCMVAAADDVVIEAAGAGASITQENGRNTANLVYTGASKRVTLRNVVLDGNDENQTATGTYFTCIRSNAGGEDIVVENVRFTRCGARATDFRGTLRPKVLNSRFVTTGRFLAYGAATIASIARSGATVTVTTSAAHGFNPGDGVAVWQVADAANFPKGVKTIAATPSSTTFTYTEAGATASSAGGFANNNGGNAISIDVTGASQSSEFWVVNNYFDRWGDAAIGAPESLRGHIIGNKLHGAAAAGEVPLLTESGISVQGSQDVEVSGNFISKVFTNCIGFRNTTVTVDYPSTRLNIHDNVLAGGAQNCSIQGNDVSYVANRIGQYNRVAHNIIVGGGIVATHQRHLAIAGNTIIDPVGGSTHIALSDLAAGVSDNFTIEGNLLAKTSGSQSSAISTSANVTGSGVVRDNTIRGTYSAASVGIQNVATIRKWNNEGDNQSDAFAVLPNGKKLASRTVAGTGYVADLYVDGSNNLQVGDPAGGDIILRNSTVAPAAANNSFGGNGREWRGFFTQASFTGALTSTLASGTAPLVVTSTTPVANLALAADTQLPTIATAGKVSDSALSANVARLNAGNSWTTGTQDFSAAGATLPVKSGLSAATPATCIASKELFLKTDATAGQQLFLCNASGNGWVLAGDGVGAGNGDSVSVNGVAATDANLNDATPAAPASAVNVKWQKDALAPNNVSAHLPYAYGLTTAGNDLAVSLTTCEAFRATDQTLTANTYADNVSCSLAAGTWLINTVTTVKSPANTAQRVTVRLGDGTTHYAASEATSPAMGTSTAGYVSVSVNVVKTLAATTTVKTQVASTAASILDATPDDNGAGLTSLANSIRAVRIGN